MINIFRPRPNKGGAIYFCRKPFKLTRYTLNKKQRLKSRKQIETIFSKGKQIRLSSYILYYERGAPRSEKIQIGFAVSKRNFRKAVDRNRIKRLGREAFRLLQNSLLEKQALLPDSLNLFLVYTGREIPAYEFVYKQVALIIQKLAMKIHENISANT